MKCAENIKPLRVQIFPSIVRLRLVSLSLPAIHCLLPSIVLPSWGPLCDGRVAVTEAQFFSRDSHGSPPARRASRYTTQLDPRSCVTVFFLLLLRLKMCLLLRRCDVSQQPPRVTICPTESPGRCPVAVALPSLLLEGELTRNETFPVPGDGTLAARLKFSSLLPSPPPFPMTSLVTSRLFYTDT